MRIKKNILKYKNPTTNEYNPIPVVATDSVTKDSIEAALGYIPADEVKVTELNEKLMREKADQFSVGNGLLMSDDRVLSVAGGSEGVYEPIMTLEATYEDQSFVVDETPDGRQWNFSAVLIIISLNGTAMTESRGFNLWGKHNFGEALCGFTVEKQSGNRRSLIDMGIDRGAWKGTLTQMTGNPYYSISKTLDLIKTKPIQEFPAIYGMSTSKWPVGTTIDIYGVWKDE